MINSIGSCGVHAADIAALRRNSGKKAAATQGGSVETDATGASGAHKHQHRPPGLARAAENAASKIFNSADADGSGGISQEELTSALSKHADRINADDLFKALDSDGDGSVSKTELQDALKKFFYSKVGVTYQPQPPVTTDPPTQPEPTTPPTDTTSGDQTTLPVSTDTSFTAVA
jgi:hypothetical protein